MHAGLETFFMIQYKIYSFGFLESSEMNRNIFYSLISGKYNLFHHFHFRLLCSVGYDTLSFEDVLTSALDVFETEEKKIQICEMSLDL